MTAPSIRMDGRSALVTGGGAGIGRAIAEAFAELGARVAVAEIDPARASDVEAALAAIGDGHLVRKADVRSSDDMAAVMGEIEAEFGRLDVLVNNVGDALAMGKKFELFTDEECEALYQINLRHMFVVTRMALPLMRKSGDGGSIINISTIEAYRGAPPAALYSAFKAGITGFTRSLALELAPETIRVNIIAPETTSTPQVPVPDVVPPELRDNIERWIPMARFGLPQDAAGCAVFLATELSSWVTGTTVHLDGGALAAGGFYRTPQGYWTNFPVITGAGGGTALRAMMQAKAEGAGG